MSSFARVVGLAWLAVLVYDAVMSAASRTLALGHPPPRLC
jgi:hypothetical protein